MKTKSRRWQFEEVRQYFADYECELLSKTYDKKKSLLKYRCKCGKINCTSFDGFFNSKYKKCHFCAKAVRPSKVKIGEKYGKLLVIQEAPKNKWGRRTHVCRCDCGTEKIIENMCLIRGDTKTCGKCKKDSLVLIELEGKIFGSLEVIRKTEKTYHGTMIWECVCSCGRKVNMNSIRLRSSEYPNCGYKECPEYSLEKEKLHKKRSNSCQNAQKKLHGYCRKDLIGMRFGKLVVKEITEDIVRGGKHGCVCICDCGCELVIGSNWLRDLNMTDCGCVTGRGYTKFNEIELNLVLGTLLGDGCLRKSKNLASLTINHCTKQEELVDWKYNILKKFVRSKPRECKNPGYNKNSMAKRFRTISTEQLNKIYKILYGSGRKKITKKYLSMITDPIALAVWYMDDGSCGKKNYNCNIHTESFSFEEVQLISKWLKNKWGIDGTKPYVYKKKDKEYVILTFSAKARNQFFDLIKPHIIDCMKYKLQQPSKLISS
jgi:hypothetical protein